MPNSLIRLFEDVLALSGVEPALEVLNRGLPHRYTAIFRLDHDTLVNLYLFDKQGQLRPEALERVPLVDSFCQLVLKQGFLKSDNSVIDPRLDFSPFQGMVVSYHGVPIENNAGGLYGTLCHFDMVERQISDEDFDSLQRAARQLPRYMK